MPSTKAKEIRLLCKKSCNVVSFFFVSSVYEENKTPKKTYNSLRVNRTVPTRPINTNPNKYKIDIILVMDCLGDIMKTIICGTKNRQKPINPKLHNNSLIVACE